MKPAKEGIADTLIIAKTSNAMSSSVRVNPLHLYCFIKKYYPLAVAWLLQ
jgi:hypothetical protein